MAREETLDSIIDDAMTKLEARWDAIQAQLKPLKDEEAQVAATIHRVSGSFPSGYSAAPAAAPAARTTSSTRTRSTLTDNEKRAAILEAVNAGAQTNTEVASQLSVSVGTVTVTINDLIEAGAITTNGKTRRARKLLPAG